MNPLLSKYIEYQSIVNYKFVYEFANDSKLEFKLERNAFPHLLGLHKLTDIPIIQQFNDPTRSVIGARYLLSRIRQERLLTDSIVRSSSNFHLIEERYNNFTKEKLLTVSYTDVIIDFNPQIIRSSLKAKYILYERQKNGGYNHLCIACNDSVSYAESFFHQPTSRYLEGQNTCAVTKVEIYDDRGSLYFTDCFI